MDTNFEWMTEYAVSALDEIVDADGKSDSLDARKRRHTIQRMAWAIVADGETPDRFFEREKGYARSDLRRDRLLMARSSWWKHKEDTAIRHALNSCIKAAQEWKSKDVQRQQVSAREKIDKELAKNAVEAVVGGLMALIQDSNARGDHRLQGIDRYIQLLSPDLASRIPVDARSSIPVEVTDAPPMVQIVMPDNARNTVSERNDGGAAVD